MYGSKHNNLSSEVMEQTVLEEIELSCQNGGSLVDIPR